MRSNVLNPAVADTLLKYPVARKTKTTLFSWQQFFSQLFFCTPCLVKAPIFRLSNSEKLNFFALREWKSFWCLLSAEDSSQMPLWSWFSVPAVSAQAEEEEELVDPQDTLKAECAPKCSSWKDKLETCNDRVNSRSQTTESCLEELFDFLHCVDGCVVKDLFKKLK